MPDHNALVMKFGGSNAITEEGANLDYLHSFLSHFTDLFKQYEKITLVIGGGVRVRIRQAQVTTNEEKDIVGMQTTWEHAEQMGGVVRDQLGLEIAPTVPHNPEEAKELLENNRVVVMGGLQIGQSTDAVSAYAAHRYQVMGYKPQLIILSNINKIFTADPKKDPNATPIDTDTIESLVAKRVLVDDPAAWIPGMAVTIDPVAVKLLLGETGKQTIPVFFGHGDDWENPLHFLHGEQVNNGTVLGQNSDE